MPTPKQIDAILPFLDRFTSEGFTAGTLHSPPGKVPWFEYGNAVSEFQKALYDNDWIPTTFKWSARQEAAQEYVANPGRIDSADAETIQKLFTTHVRKERFSEGHLAAMFENGHMVALLRRLQDLRGQID